MTHLEQTASPGTELKIPRVSFRIRLCGRIVARTEGRVMTAEAEIMHYARHYRRDGEVTIQHNAEGHWKRYALLCQWPPAIALAEGRTPTETKGGAK